MVMHSQHRLCFPGEHQSVGGAFDFAESQPDEAPVVQSTP